MEDERWDELKDHVTKWKERLEREIEERKDILLCYAKNRSVINCEDVIKSINQRMDELNNVNYIIGTMHSTESKYDIHK